MHCLVVLLLALLLQGCWFIYIPAGMFQEGNSCSGESVYVGQRLKHDDGRTGTVEKVIGRHERCQSSARPMLVSVKYD